MQILGKRSKVLLIALSIVMLVAVGVSFAMWDINAVKATNGNLSEYANAKVGDVITFGNYYQTGKRINNDENAEYEKTPIEWIVVDKDDRTGQLTLMSKYILAAGSYFGNWYYSTTTSGMNYQLDSLEIDGSSFNPAYVESTARAFLNNLERRDLGGDSYSIDSGYITSYTPSDKASGILLPSVGFSNKKYNISGDVYQRPIYTKAEYIKRPATRGFYDEAFSEEEKAIIVPKVIPGYTGYRWPNSINNPANMSYVEGSVDKIWLPSATELNIMSNANETINPSDANSSTVFAYFRDKTATVLKNALKTRRTAFVESNSKAMNYSIPVYKYQSTEINEDIHITNNSRDYYWTRTQVTTNTNHVCYVDNVGVLIGDNTHTSNYGIRPCLILKY